MSKKRKDNKGRILQKGESQRKNGTYQFRYADYKGNRQCIYAATLSELRKKEKQIQILADRGGDYAAGNITVSELLARYIALKQNIRTKTKELYTSRINFVNKSEFGSYKINNVKTSVAKQWVIDLKKQGMAFSSIKATCAILFIAFQMAVEEDILAKNPFNFYISNVIDNDSTERVALTEEQQDIFFGYLHNHRKLAKYYDELLFLPETGLRVSEMCGLTVSDVDIEKRCITIDKQLLKDSHGNYYIGPPKSESGKRTVPLSLKAFEIVNRRIENKLYLKNVIIDGYSRFLFYNNTLVPRTAHNYDYMCRKIMEAFINDNPDKYVPKVTPHVLRHTYCTNMQNNGVNAKVIQYLMGHANVDITMNTYTHQHYDNVEEIVFKLPQYRQNA